MTREKSSDTLLEQLIGSVRESHKRTNIVDVDLSCLPFHPEKRIGRIVCGAENLSHKEFVVSFDPVETIFLQKMITEQSINQNIILEKEDYLQGMIFLDFFSTYILRDQSIFPQICALDKRVEKTNDSMGVNIEICTMYVAMQYAARTIQQKIRPVSKKIFDQDNTFEEIIHENLRPLDTISLEVGRLMYDMLSLPETKEAVVHAQGRADMKAIVFLDTVARYLQDTHEKEKVMQRLSRGEFYTAGTRAFYALASETNQRRFDNAIQSLRRKYEVRT